MENSNKFKGVLFTYYAHFYNMKYKSQVYPECVCEFSAQKLKIPPTDHLLYHFENGYFEWKQKHANFFFKRDPIMLFHFLNFSKCVVCMFGHKKFPLNISLVLHRVSTLVWEKLFFPIQSRSYNCTSIGSCRIEKRTNARRWHASQWLCSPPKWEVCLAI